MEVRDIKISDIVIGSCNIRKDLIAGTEDATIDDLASSITERGLLSPITVRRIIDDQTKNETYSLVAGKRRLMACQKLGWETIPSIVKDIGSDMCCIMISLVENIHRADLNPLDKARAFHTISVRYDGDVVRVSKETGVTTTTIKRYLGLLNLAPPIQEKLEQVRKTRDGPAGISTLSRLSSTFKPEEHEEALKVVGGYNQDIQVEIIKKSEGDMNKLYDLGKMAEEGVFCKRICRGIYECSYIPEHIKPIVQESVDEFKEKGEIEGDLNSTHSVKRLDIVYKIRDALNKLDNDDDMQKFKNEMTRLANYGEESKSE